MLNKIIAGLNKEATIIILGENSSSLMSRLNTHGSDLLRIDVAEQQARLILINRNWRFRDTSVESLHDL